MRWDPRRPLSGNIEDRRRMPVPSGVRGAGLDPGTGGYDLFSAPQSGYHTVLMPWEEKAFQRWFRQIKAQLGRDLDPNDPGYDMRGFWRAEQLGGRGMSRDPASGEMHFPDTFKTPQHP